VIQKQFKMKPNTGIARLSAMLVIVSSRFSSKIELEYQGHKVNLKNSAQSLMELMDLKLYPGCQFLITVHGVDAYEVLHTINVHIREAQAVKNSKKLVLLENVKLSL